MQVSSRNMFPTARNLQIRVHVYRPRHCCGDWLTFGCFVPMIADHGLVKTSFGRSWPREEKINNHGCWGKHAHIPDNEYWGICLFHVMWTNFCCCNYSYVVHTEYIFYFFSSTEHCAWAIISPKEFKSWVTHISFALLYRKTDIFCALLLKSAFEWIFNDMQLILVKFKWHIKWKYLIKKIPRYLPFILL